MYVYSIYTVTYTYTNAFAASRLFPAVYPKTAAAASAARTTLIADIFENPGPSCFCYPVHPPLHGPLPATFFHE